MRKRVWAKGIINIPSLYISNINDKQLYKIATNSETRHIDAVARLAR